MLNYETLPHNVIHEVKAPRTPVYYYSRWVPFELDGEKIIPPPVTMAGENIPRTLQDVRDAVRRSSVAANVLKAK